MVGAVLVSPVFAAAAVGQAPPEVSQTVRTYEFTAEAGSGEVLSILRVGDGLYLDRIFLETPSGELFSLTSETFSRDSTSAISFLHEGTGWWASIEIDMGLGKLPDIADPTFVQTLAHRLREEDPLIEVILQTIDGSYWRTLQAASDEREVIDVLVGDDRSTADSTPKEAKESLSFLRELLAQGFLRGSKTPYLEVLLEVLSGTSTPTRPIEGHWTERSREEIEDHLRQFGSLTALERRAILSLLPEEPAD